MNKNRPKILRLTKETPEARKKRVSSGVKCRASVFIDKRKRLLDKYYNQKEEPR